MVRPVQIDPATEQTLNRALSTESVNIDDRDLATLLKLAARYAELINFYDSQNNRNGSWSPFFLKDPRILTAVISKTNYKKLHLNFEQLKAKYKKKNVTVDQNDPAELVLSELNIEQISHIHDHFYAVLELYNRFNTWLHYMDTFKGDYALKTWFIKHIKSTYAAQLKDLLYWCRLFGVTPQKELIAEEQDFPAFQKVWQKQNHFLPEKPKSIDALIERIEHFFKQAFDFLVQLVLGADSALNSLLQLKNDYPDTALLVAFIKIMGVHQAQLNQLSHRHLRFYYQDILKTEAAPASPDQTLVFFALNKKTQQFLLPVNTEFNAGYDKQKQPIVFSNPTEQWLNHTSVVSAYSLFNQTAPEQKLMEQASGAKPITISLSKATPSNATLSEKDKSSAKDTPTDKTSSLEKQPGTVASATSKTSMVAADDSMKPPASEPQEGLFVTAHPAPEKVVATSSGEQVSWLAFGEAPKKEITGQGSNKKPQKSASQGQVKPKQINQAIVFSSPMLYMASGDRQFSLQLQFSQDVSTTLFQDCKFFISTEKAWLSIKPVTVIRSGKEIADDDALKEITAAVALASKILQTIKTAKTNASNAQKAAEANLDAKAASATADVVTQLSDSLSDAITAVELTDTAFQTFNNATASDAATAIQEAKTKLSSAITAIKSDQKIIEAAATLQAIEAKEVEEVTKEKNAANKAKGEEDKKNAKTTEELAKRAEDEAKRAEQQIGVKQATTNILNEVNGIFKPAKTAEADLKASEKAYTEAKKAAEKARRINVCIQFQLTVSDPAITLPKKPLDALDSAWPMLKIQFPNGMDLTQCYVIEKVCFSNDISSTAPEIMFNDSGVLPPKGPAALFGTGVDVGSNFYAGSREWFAKPLQLLSFQLTWQKLPDFEDYYKAYNQYLTAQENDGHLSEEQLKGFKYSQTSFNVTGEVLYNDSWSPVDFFVPITLEPGPVIPSSTGSTATIETLSSESVKSIGEHHSGKIEPLLKHVFGSELAKLTKTAVDDLGSVLISELTGMNPIASKAVGGLAGALETALKTHLGKVLDDALQQHGKALLTDELQGKLEKSFGSLLAHVLPKEAAENAFSHVQKMVSDKIHALSDYKLTSLFSNDFSKNLEDKLKQELSSKLSDIKPAEISKTIEGKLASAIHSHLKGSLSGHLSHMLQNIFDKLKPHFDKAHDRSFWDKLKGWFSDDDEQNAKASDTDNGASQSGDGSTTAKSNSEAGSSGDGTGQDTGSDKQDSGGSVNKSKDHSPITPYAYSPLFETGIDNTSYFSFDIKETPWNTDLINTPITPKENTDGVIKMTLATPGYGFGQPIYANVVSFVTLFNAQVMIGEATKNINFPTIKQDGSTTKAIQLTGKDIYTKPMANTPFVPKITKIAASYTASAQTDLTNTKSTSDEQYPLQLFHLGSFSNYQVFDTQWLQPDASNVPDFIVNAVPKVEGSSTANTGQKQSQNLASDSNQTNSNVANLVPIPALYEGVGSKGTLYFEMQDMEPYTSVSMYLNLVPSGEWHRQNKVSYFYLSASGWQSFELSSDETNNLSNPGIIVFNVPGDAAANTRLTGTENIWLAVTTNPLLTDIQVTSVQCQVARVERTDLQNFAPGEIPQLAAKSIKGSINAIPEIASVQQPFASTGGQAAQTTAQYHQGVSQRIATRDRATSLSDYQILARQVSNDIYYAKCIRDKKVASSVTLALVKRYNSASDVNAYAPVLAANVQAQVQSYIMKRSPTSVQLTVQNMSHQAIQIQATLTLKQSNNWLSLQKQINQRLKLYLSPWITSDSSQITIDQGISRSEIRRVILGFEEVISVGDLKIQNVTQDSYGELKKTETYTGETIYPTSPDVLFISAKEHDLMWQPEKVVAGNRGGRLRV